MSNPRPTPAGPADEADYPFLSMGPSHTFKSIYASDLPPSPPARTTAARLADDFRQLALLALTVVATTAVIRLHDAQAPVRSAEAGPTWAVQSAREDARRDARIAALERQANPPIRATSPRDAGQVID